jgi:arginyl-tRNA synthetase
VLSKSEDGKWEKFASRAGNAVFLDEILDEAVAKVREIIREKNPDLEGADQVAEAAALSPWPSNRAATERIASLASSIGVGEPEHTSTAARAAAATRTAPLNPSPRPIGIEVRSHSGPVPPSSPNATRAG